MHNFQGSLIKGHGAGSPSQGSLKQISSPSMKKFVRIAEKSKASVKDLKFNQIDKQRSCVTFSQIPQQVATPEVVCRLP